MPQFDTSFYLTQIIWMLGSFAFLYVMMAFLVCPMLEDVLNDRQQKIQNDLEQAERFNKQADVFHQRYQAFILSAEKEKSMRVQDAYAQIQKDAADLEHKNDVQLRRKVRQAEQKIDKATAGIRKESDKQALQIAEIFVNRLMKGGDNI